MGVRGYFRSEVTSIGVDAAEMVDGGVAIFFAEPCPAELAEVSIVHRVAKIESARDPRPGDVLSLGNSRLTITAVGETAGENLRSLGHIVVYFNPEPDQSLLPGAIQATGTLFLPAPGDAIELTAGEE